MPTTMIIDGIEYKLTPKSLDEQKTTVTPPLRYNDGNTIEKYLDEGKVKMKDGSTRQLKQSFHGVTKIDPGKSADVVRCVRREVDVMNSNIESGTIYYIDPANAVEHNNYCSGGGNKRIKSSKKKQRKFRKTRSHRK